jgi:hypothetical protein
MIFLKSDYFIFDVKKRRNNTDSLIELKKNKISPDSFTLNPPIN